MTVMQAAVEALASSVGMAACEGTDAVPPNARSHTLLLSGSIVGGSEVRHTADLSAKTPTADPLATASSTDKSTPEIQGGCFSDPPFLFCRDA